MKAQLVRLQGGFILVFGIRQQLPPTLATPNFSLPGKPSSPKQQAIMPYFKVAHYLGNSPKLQVTRFPGKYPKAGREKPDLCQALCATTFSHREGEAEL